MKDKTTIPKTLWSETLIEILIDSLKKNRPDKEIKNILMELRIKGFKSGYVTRKVEKELGKDAVRRIKSITG